MIVATFCVKFLIIAISIFLDSKISKISVVVCFVFAKPSFCKTHYLVFRVFTVRVPSPKSLYMSVTYIFLRPIN